MKPSDKPAQPARRDRLIHEHVHDPYQTRSKLPEPTVCPRCQAVFHDGRWRWGPPPAPAHQTLCPACRRIEENYPAGILTITGGFLAGHRAEIEGLIRHQEELEKGEHPMHRIMGMDARPDGLVVTTTDIHLPRRIGEALHHAYQGELDFHYDEEAYLLRVSWSREA